MTRTIPTLSLMALAALAAACDSSTDPPEPTLFQTPIEGEPYVDWYYGALPNHGGDWLIYEDYACGEKTRAFNHTTDFILPTFQAMEDGVNVLAAAAGEVVGLLDGQYDQHLVFRRGQVGNQVWLRHEDGFTSRYYNLKAGIPVERGEWVEAGQVIGQAGSSGYSNWPRLGFEARDADDEPFDPWTGPCSGPRSYWVDQYPEYPDRFVVIDNGTMSAPPVISIIAEGPPRRSTFAQGYAVGFWAHVMNRPAGVLSLEVLDPDGLVEIGGSAEFERPRVANDILGGVLYLAPDAKLGTWVIQWAMDGDVFVRSEIDVVPAADDLAGLHAPAGLPAPTTSGETRLEIDEDLTLDWPEQ